MNVSIIDYDAGNLRNVQKIIEKIGHKTFVAKSPDELAKADAIVLPGVGSFHKGSHNLHESGLLDAMRFYVLEKKKPFLGICLGMQLIAEGGDEGGRSEGLGFIPVEIHRLRAEQSGLRLPHIGWNAVTFKENSILFNGIPQGADFYFVHSYFVDFLDAKYVSATCEYGHVFAAAIEYGNIFAVQFHPEKSQRYGELLMMNFLTYCQNCNKLLD